MKLTVKNINGKDSGELQVKFPLVEGGKGIHHPTGSLTHRLAHDGLFRAGNKVSVTAGQSWAGARWGLRPPTR